MNPNPVPADLDAATELVETLDSAISALRGEVRRLYAARTVTLQRIAEDIARLAEENSWDSARLLEVYEALNRPSFFTAWQTAGLPHHARLRADAARLRQREGA